MNTNMKKNEGSSQFKQPLVDFVEEVDTLLAVRHGITHEDTNLDLIRSCHRAGETPEECVEQIATKYDLERIDEVYLPIAKGGLL